LCDIVFRMFASGEDRIDGLKFARPVSRVQPIHESDKKKTATAVPST